MVVLPPTKEKEGLKKEGGRERFAGSDCDRRTVAEDVLYTVINSRPNVIYGPTRAVL